MFGTNSIQHVRDGEVISLGAPRAGLRSYLAVRGGFCVQPVLGSRSYDVMSAIGPSPLQAGDVLPVGEHTDDYPELDQAPVAAISAQSGRTSGGTRAARRLVRRSRRVGAHDWVASDRSDRVGMRLEGRPLRYRYPDRQLPSEGATRGAIQVPPNGLPVILGPDHPVTGGYPVIGVVIDEDIDKVAQVRPGQHVRLHWARPRSPFAAQGADLATGCRQRVCTPRYTPPAWSTPAISTATPVRACARWSPKRSPVLHRPDWEHALGGMHALICVTARSSRTPPWSSGD